MPLHATPRLVRRLTANLRLMDPLLMNTNFSFLKNVSAHTGGGATRLDGIDTTRVTRPYLAKIRVLMSDGLNFQLQGWLARARAPGESETAPATAPEDFRFVVPDNWDELTNNVIWERVE